MGWEYLGGCIARSSASYKIICGFIELVCKSKIEKHRCYFSLQKFIFLNHYIVKFYIAVHYLVFMKIGNCTKKLSNDLLRNAFLWKAVFFDKAQERERKKLSNHINWILWLVCRMKFSNIFMIQTIPNVDLIDKIILQ